MRTLAAFTLLLALLAPAATLAARKPAQPPEEQDQGPFNAETFAGLEFRSIGPALLSGRVGDVAVNPANPAQFYVAVSSGGVWKTINDGTTWTPLFDDQGSYSIGCVALDPTNPLVVWVGTGENNSQRSVSYGDGLYKSVDGGKNWKKVGLESSEHIGKVLIDPRDTDTVYVAAQGPLWAPGGERGLYKTVDGGATWEIALEISENTGVTDVVLDPRDPDVLYAAAYQRRRHVWTLIDGGPESAIYKSTDAGASWEKLERGLPEADMGRIGLAVSPADPDVVYAIIEAERDEGGFFRSTDAGSTWEKRDDYLSGSPQYYQEIVADPRNVDRVYSLDTWLHVTEDGGLTWRKVGEKAKHVDNHALWINPENTDHLIAGCDGGVYESWDRGATWQYKANLPVTQFYKIAADNDTPFYNVYGGTQDNNTLGGPSRSTSANGIVNSDWFVTLGGDGFKPQIDPENPDIVYSQYQYGELARYDRKSGERIDIQPQPGPGEEGLRWNWDSALIISPHSSTRLYFAAQKIFRSDDRGDSWTAVSPDLTRQIDRNTLEVMGRVQKADAVAKGDSTSYYGNIVSLSESPLVEGLLYAGTDDGLVQVLEPGSSDWRRIESFPGVPELSYVADLETSRHDADTLFAAFDNHKSGDFRPYLLRSGDRGRSWTSIAGDLPERGTVYTVVEDHVNPALLFAGTEFGVFFTVDGGVKWVQLEGGIPVIAVRDLEIQRRESDLVVGTFGRGIYILDDYAPLREVDDAMLEKEAWLFPVKPAWMFMHSAPFGLTGKSMQGDGFYTAPNPPFGAVLTYYLKDELATLEKTRLRREKEAEEQGQTAPYPTWDELRAESREIDPAVVLTVSDEEGNVVRRIEGPTCAGLHRVSWDLRYPPADPVQLEEPTDVSPWDDPRLGSMVLPGDYEVSLAKRVGGTLTPLGEPQRVMAMPLNNATLPAEDKRELHAFQRQVAGLQRAVLGASRSAEEAQDRIDHLRHAVLDTPGADVALLDELDGLETRLKDLLLELHGDPVRQSRNEPTPPSIQSRVQRIVRGQWTSTSAPTSTNREAYRIAGEAFAVVLGGLQRLIESDLEELESRLERAGAPWTPGRVPRWAPE
jgi:photosystem II stability/assembly factor-like uncharacterized protein